MRLQGYIFSESHLQIAILEEIIHNVSSDILLYFWADNENVKNKLFICQYRYIIHHY